MAELHFVTSGSENAERLHVATQEARGHHPRTHHAGSDTEPQLADVYLAPNAETARHAHTEHEIKAVYEGSLIFGDVVLRPGDSVFVPANTEHSYVAGPEGCRFWNFRQRAASSVLAGVSADEINDEQFRELLADQGQLPGRP